MTELSPEARRLQLLVKLTSTDGLLDSLAQLAAGPNPFVGVPITLMVDGAMVQGTLATAEQFAAHADHAFSSILRNSPIAGVEPSETERTRTSLVSALEERGWLQPLSEHGAELRRDARRRVDAFLERLDDTATVKLDNLPSDLVEDAVTDAASLPVLTLSNASVFMAGHGWTKVGFMRVVTSHVAGWWVAEDPDRSR